MLTVKNLVFKGGGVLGIAYAGAIEILEEKQLLQTVERVAGTSAGAITAALISLRYSAADILQIVNSTDFKSFEDGWDPLRIPTKYGLYKGDAFLEWMQKQITGKGLSADATFKDFAAKGCRDLHVFAADLNIKGLAHFSLETTPDTIVAEAVRASMSIPLFFKAWVFSNSNPNNHVYVDGGTIYNFPITIFDKDGPDPETLGLYLTDLHDQAPASNLQYDQLIQYVQDLFQTLLDAQDIDFEHDADEEHRTIIIDNLGISPTNFGLIEDQKKALYESGKKYASDFIARELGTKSAS
jgi:NTE family protein